MRNLHVCVFTSFLKYLEFSDFKRPILNIDLKILSLNVLGADMHYCDMIAPQICFLFRQADVINRTFVNVHLWGVKKLEPRIMLKL